MVNSRYFNQITRAGGNYILQAAIRSEQMKATSRYRLIFGLAAIYNIAFGLWTCLWPQSFFQLMKMVSPNYPSLWSCLGMVVGLYGLLYGYSACRLDRAFPIILIGLLGKILGPLGWVIAVRSGEWPLRTLPLVVFNDLIWWVPFALFLLKGKQLISGSSRLPAGAVDPPDRE